MAKKVVKKVQKRSSYEGIICPCGGKKEGGTMLCDACVAAFKEHPSYASIYDKELDVDLRRHAAHTILALAHKRRM